MSPLLGFLLASAVAAPAPPAKFHAQVSLVRVDVGVKSKDGRTLDGLRPGDFRVYEDGKLQPITQFSAGDEPLDLILLFDVSGSMRPAMAQVAAAAHDAFHQLQPGDRVSVMVFNTQSQVVSPFTEDLNEVERAIQSDVLGLPFEGGTFIQQAVDDAALRFMKQPHSNRRRAVLIITDNMGRRTRREQSVVRDFWEADAVLSGLIVSSPATRALRTFGAIIGPQTLLLRAGIEGIAAKTGGDSVPAGEDRTAFGEAVRRIRTRYSLFYPLPAGKPKEERKIRVKLSPEAAKQFPGASVKARSGYVAPDLDEGAEPERVSSN
jgi:VWFA-related protein